MSGDEDKEVLAPVDLPGEAGVWISQEKPECFLCLLSSCLLSSKQMRSLQLA